MTFEELLLYLSEKFEVELKVDEYDSCSIQIDEKYILQLEMDFANRRLMIASFISALDPGKFRENILLNALKANDLPTRIGSFGFLLESSELILHHFFPLSNLEEKTVADYLAEMIYVASSWKEAIDQGRPGISEIPIKNHAPPFGLQT